MNAKTVLMLCMGLAVAHAIGAPVVSNVQVTQLPDASSCIVTYDLTDGPAIITFDVQTNNASIGGRHLTRVQGDVNRLVSGASGMFRMFPAEASQGCFSNMAIPDAKVVVTAWPTNSTPDYMVVDLGVTNSINVNPVSYYPTVDQIPGGIANPIYKTEKLVMRRIPAAGVRWRMGSCAGEVGRRINDYNLAREIPHYVTFTNDYYIGVYELTQAQYYRFAYDHTYPTPSNFKDAEDSAMRPLENLSWAQMRGCFNEWHGVWPNLGHEVPSYCPIAKLRLRTGIEFDLPTEAQWEFACRAGCPSALYTGEELEPQGYSGTPEYGGRSDALDALGWYQENSDTGNGLETHVVGLKLPNDFGLYDMLGNVAEFCLDGYADANSNPSWPYEISVTDPVGPLNTTYNTARVHRGGSYGDVCQTCRSAFRVTLNGANTASPTVGFRLWCPVGAPDF
ncbi:MAG: formylglycine-generating enzyme family protein [Kiritimatiellae bacterium]|nr:formylglycine-generating enzyme family protein [Kiritimatiellia bacterium]